MVQGTYRYKVFFDFSPLSCQRIFLAFVVICVFLRHSLVFISSSQQSKHGNQKTALVWFVDGTCAILFDMLLICLYIMKVVRDLMMNTLQHHVSLSNLFAFMLSITLINELYMAHFIKERFVTINEITCV